MRERICSRSGLCSTRWHPGTLPFRGDSSGSHLWKRFLTVPLLSPLRSIPMFPREAGRDNHQPRDGKRSQFCVTSHAADVRAELQRLKRDSESGHTTVVARPAAKSVAVVYFGIRAGPRKTNTSVTE